MRICLHQSPPSEFKCIKRDGYWYFVCVCLAMLIQEAAAAPRAAVAMQLAVLVLDGELVVVGQLFAPVDLPQGEDDDVLAAVHVDDARVAVGLARVVDEAGRVALHRRVHHVEVVDAEHVAADALKRVIKRQSDYIYSTIDSLKLETSRSIHVFDLWVSNRMPSHNELFN